MNSEVKEADSAEEAVRQVEQHEETGVMAIDYHYIIVHSARAIQQLNAEVQALKALIGKP